MEPRRRQHSHDRIARDQLRDRRAAVEVGPAICRRSVARSTGQCVPDHQESVQQFPAVAGEPVGAFRQTVRLSKMSNDLMTTQQHSVIELDGLSGGYLDDSGRGDEERVSSRVIQGGKIKFNDPNWYLNGQVITGQLLTIIAMRKIVNKWTADGKPLETQILLPSDPFPDFKALDAKCPKNEWF